MPDDERGESAGIAAERRDVSAVILAGGTSRRMGQDKAHLVLEGTTLLERSVAVLSTLCDDILVTGRDALPDSTPGVRAMRDDAPGNGPLGGLATGMLHARHPLVIAVSCDLPFLSAGALAKLVDLADGYQAVVPFLAGRSQPLHAVYSTSIYSEVRRRVRRRDLRMGDLLDVLRVRWVDEAELANVDPNMQSTINVNTEGDWQSVLARSRGGAT